MKEVKKDNPGLILLTDGLKLDSAQVAAAVCQEEKSTAKQKEKSAFLKKNKEILDIELYAILEVLEIEEKLANPGTPVTNFSDS